MPFVMGVHSSLIASVNSRPLEDHVFVDVDKSIVRTPFHDLEELPVDLVR